LRRDRAVVELPGASLQFEKEPSFDSAPDAGVASPDAMTSSATPPRVSSETAGKPVIEFRGAQYRLADGNILLNDFELAIAGGETMVLLGRSGAGKTTALKLINRLLEPSAGEVRVDGRSTLAWDAIALRRHIGYVIQDTGLFPHYTVEQNVSVTPRLERWERPRMRQRAEELLALVGLDPRAYLGRYPHELSGGQRQRVGLARALAADPPILLMDEPFGALDPLTRMEVRQEFRQLQSGLRKTVVIVTHDVGEAVELGTRIALLEAGELRGVHPAKTFLQSNEPLAAAFLAQIRALAPEATAERSESPGNPERGNP
jgi:osmoprotectant transport system ATP-binding protein